MPPDKLPVVPRKARDARITVGVNTPFLLVMPFSLLSGLTTPVTSMPEFLQTVMVINPLCYALDLTKRVYLEDAGFAQLLSDFLPLTLIGLVTLAGAAWLFQRRVT